MNNILFFDPNLNERGTSIATYDYAHFNEIILGNKSIIVAPKSGELKSLEKFKKRFSVHLIDSIGDIDRIVSEQNINLFYSLKYGHNDGLLIKGIKNLVHVVFPSYDPHGDVYAYVSSWLAKTHGNNSPFVPHMINLPQYDGDFREYLNIPEHNFVVGWYGGNNFEIEFARQAVVNIAKIRKDITFLFMNQTAFCNESNVMFIDGTTDQTSKVAFINTCDAMIHARERGETFGLAIAEFSSLNKPIITFSNSPEKAHIDVLGGKGIYYSNYNDLYQILNSISRGDIEGKEWNCYQEYTPENVMDKFNEVFLK